jgi:hypothetical protein
MAAAGSISFYSAPQARRHAAPSDASGARVRQFQQKSDPWTPTSSNKRGCGRHLFVAFADWRPGDGGAHDLGAVPTLDAGAMIANGPAETARSTSSSTAPMCAAAKRAVLRPGDLFGEMSLSTASHARQAHAIVTSGAARLS